MLGKRETSLAALLSAPASQNRQSESLYPSENGGDGLMLHPGWSCCDCRGSHPLCARWPMALLSLVAR